MAEIHDLDVLVPGDITFKYRGKEYTLSGDVSPEAVFRMVKLFQSVKADAAVEEAEPLINKLRDELLLLFQQHDPKLKELPFGIVGIRHIAQILLVRLGLAVQEQPADPTPPKPKRTPRKR